MTPDEVTAALVARYPGLAPQASWGETSLFYNPGLVLKRGVYFCTIKDHDGANDKASHLDRPEVFEDLQSLFAEAHRRAAATFAKRVEPGAGIEPATT